MNKIKVAVIGVGRLGYYHAATYARLSPVELIAVCDTDLPRAEKVAQELHCDYATDYCRLFNKVDAVSISVPTSGHYKIAKAFLGHKIHVLVEKPITKTVHEAEELLLLAKKNRCILQVGHIERFNSAFCAVQKMISKPKFIECHRLGPFDPRVKDVGVVLDLMIHDIDIVLGLVKSEIKKIDAVGVNILTPHEDIANVRLTFKNGTICNLTASRVTKEKVRKFRIFLEDTYISLDYINQEADIYQKINGTIIEKKLNIQKEKPLDQELLSFINCVKSGKPPIVSGKEALDALTIALKIAKKIKHK